MGTPITLSADGLTPGKQAEFVWVTVRGSYDLNPLLETVEFHDRKFDEARVPLGQSTIDGNGHVSAKFTIPEDYGETHDIVLNVDGNAIAKGGFAVVRNVTITPTSGPVGTPITIEVKGLGWTAFANTMGVIWDNSYTGFVSAVTTKGTAVAQIRAAGSAGSHELRLTDASAAMPYLNAEQSPRKLPQFKFTFTITGDDGAPAPTVDRPAAGAVATGGGVLHTTAARSTTAGGVTGTFSPPSSPILSKTTLKASNLPAGANVDLVWISAKGNRVSPSGWNLTDRSLGKATVASDGTINSQIEIPDDLGGWHVLRLVQGERVLTEIPYYVERSLAGVAPARVKAGESFKIQLKGIGWTELDNGVAVTYDNRYLGYACGFNSQGDITLTFTASGLPGTHLIDIYPMIFLGHGQPPWDYDIPQLSFARDNPGLALGYNLPAFRLAITVVE